MSDQMESALLEALSSPGSHVEPYVLACSLARTQTPSGQTLSLLLKLCCREDRDRWLEIVRRFSNLHLQAVFEVYRNELVTYSGMMEHLIGRQCQPALNHMVQVMLQHVHTAAQSASSGPSLELLCSTMADLFRLSVAYPAVVDTFLKDQQITPFLRCSCNLASRSYLDMLGLLLKRYSQLEQANIVSLNFFEFNRFFQLLAQFLKLLLEELLRHRLTEGSLTIITLLCRSQSMRLAISRHLGLIAELAVRELEQYSGTIEATMGDHISEVINYEYDVLGPRSSGTVATLSAELLVQLCKNIDGAMSKLLRTTLSAIGKLYLQEPQHCNPKQEFYTLSGSAAHTRLASYYLILCVISQPVLGRDDLKEELANFAAQHQHYLLAVHDQYPLVSFRIVKFVECYSTVLLIRQLEQAVGLLLRCVRNHSNSIFGQQACESLQTVLREENLGKSLQSCIYEALSPITAILQVTSNQRFVELVIFLVKTFKTPTERYSVAFLNVISKRIARETKEVPKQHKRGSHMLLLMFECFIAVLSRGNVFEEQYMSMDDLLKGLPELLADCHHITFESKIMEVAGLIVEKSGELNDYAIKCLTYMRGVYEKTYTLSELHSFMYKCIAFGSRFIMWEARQVIRLFSDVLLDNLQRTASDHRGFADCCYLLMALLQYFDQYYKQEKTEREDILKAVRALLPASGERRLLLEQVLISLFYVQPFPSDDIQLTLSTDHRCNKMLVLYACFSVQHAYTDEKMDACLRLASAYIAGKLVWKPKNDRMQREESDMEEEVAALPRVIYLDQKLLNFPLLKLQELDMLKELVRQLEKTRTINYINLSEQSRTLIKQLPNIIACGDKMRTFKHFGRQPEEA